MPLPTFTQLVVFGDSDSDGGAGARGLYEYSNHTRPAEPYFQGRATNGFVWPEYFTRLLGIPYDPTNNYAVGGAQTGLTNVLTDALYANTGMLAQVRGYVATHPQLDARTLFAVWGGGNDFFRTDCSRDTMLTEAMDHLRTAIRLLINAGARTILMGTLPSAGHYPMHPLTEKPEYHHISHTFNQHLQSLIDDLRSESHATFVVAPIAELVDAVIASPAQFGFLNTQHGYRTVTSPDGDADTYVYWDGVHFTTAFHKLMAERFAQAITAVDP